MVNLKNDLVGVPFAWMNAATCQVVAHFPNPKKPGVILIFHSTPDGTLFSVTFLDDGAVDWEGSNINKMEFLPEEFLANIKEGLKKLRSTGG